MVKKLNKIIIIILIVIIICLTIYKINKKHEEKLYEVLYSEIKYAAKNCNLEGNCEKNITLNNLYEKKYLDIKYDPVTKVELDKNIKIEIGNTTVKIEKK